MEHLQSEEPFSSDPYFSNYLKDLKQFKFSERFSELINDLPKSETKITVASWCSNEIIPVSTALGTGTQYITIFTSNLICYTQPKTLLEHKGQRLKPLLNQR